MAASKTMPLNPSAKSMRCALYARYSAKPDEYIDRNVSAKELDRPALERLRDALAMRKYDVIICHSPDRLSRNVVDSMVLLQEISKYGVKLVFVSGSYDDSPEGELSFGMQSLVAQYERKKFAERSRRGRKRKAREGF